MEWNDGKLQPAPNAEADDLVKAVGELRETVEVWLQAPGVVGAVSLLTSHD
jgi:hypothetical protein